MKIRLRLPRFETLLVLGILVAAAPAAAVVVDGIAAVVNGEIITLLDLEKAGRMALDERLRAAPPEEQDRVRREVLRPLLDQLILQRLQAQRARVLGIQVSAQEADAAIAAIMAENHLTADMLDRFLAERKATREEYRREIQEQIRLSKTVQQEVRSRVTVTEEEVAAYYQEHRGDWSRPEKVRVRHLLVPLPPEAKPDAVEAARQEARGIVDEAKRGTDFLQLLRTHAPATAPGNEDPVSAELSREELTPELAAAAFALSPGGVSDPVQSAAGFHVVQVVAKTPAYQPPLAEVRSSIEQKLVEQKSRGRYDAWIKRLNQDAIVDIKY